MDWILITDQLPEIDHEVLLRSRKEQYMIGIYKDNGLFRIISKYQLQEDGSIIPLTTGLHQSYFTHWALITAPAAVTTVTPNEEKVCAECGHSESRHLTLGGFCKHCTCTQFIEELASKPTIKKLLGDWLEERRLTQRPPLPQDATIYIMAFVAWAEKK